VFENNLCQYMQDVLCDDIEFIMNYSVDLWANTDTCTFMHA